MDFIGNYEKAGKAPLLLSGEQSFNKKGFCEYQDLEYPDDCIVDFDMRLIDLFKEIDKKKLTLKMQIRQEYYRVKELLDGKRPSRMDCYSDSHQLANYMVLRPDWITNAIYIILFNGVKYAKNGIIDHNSLFELLSNKKNGKRVLQIEYSNSEIEYVLGVVRKFKLSYRLNDISEFIPMLCDRNEPDIVDEYMNRTEILEYQIEYKYLPLNVMHRLMVEMRNDIVIEYVWLTGALFEAKEMMLSALVKAEDNILKIYIKAGNKLFPASSYLGFIRNIVNNINRDMGLCVEEKIIYKEGVLREKFDYLGLVDSFKYGNKTQYSSTLKKNIDIEEILKMAEGEEEKLRKQLKNDLIDACKMMQSNSIYWDCKEDVRNTYIRDILRAKKYIVSDQILYLIFDYPHKHYTFKYFEV